MKRSTCHMLLGIGIVWILAVTSILLLSQSTIFDVLEAGSLGARVVLGIGNSLAIFGILLNLPSLILIIVATSKWNSEEE